MDRKSWDESNLTANRDPCERFQESAEVVDAWQDDENANLAAHRPLRALVVDDNMDLAYMMSVMIEKCGHEARIAYDGLAALKIASAFDPDVAFIDIAMPRMDGYCVARELRQPSEFSDCLLVAVTGYADAAHHALGMKAGFDHYVAKPIAFRTLSELLLLARNRLVRSNEGRDEAREAMYASVN
jgi:CheY-like chemotaxis protein